MDRSRARTGGPQPHNPAAIGIHRTGAAETSASRRAGLTLRLDSSARRNLGAFGLGWFLLIAIALTGWFVVLVPLRADILDNDLTLVYIGARIGLEHGWSHIYSLSLQHALFSQLRPGAVFNDGERFVSPPPFAWLLVPLGAFGPSFAVYAWLAISLAALGAAWWLAAPEGKLPMRALWLLAALAWYPVLYSLAYAQPDLVILLALATAWRLADAKKPYLAGLVLGLSVLKPQLVFFVPLVLLFAGRWRIVATFALTVLALAVISLAMIGTQGLSDYQSLLNEARHVTNNRYFTLAYFLGPGTLSYLAQAIVAVAAAVAAYLARQESNARIFALGIVATTLGATYWHLQDFTVLVLAVWLFWREDSSAWQRWWLLVVALAGEFAWPLTPAPILLAVAVWLAFIAIRPKPALA